LKSQTDIYTHSLHCVSEQKLKMNGINGHPGPPGLWQEARNADGRVYYYNTVTKATQWNKPEELMTPAEVRLTPFPLILY
jgi:hypothetical protein